MLSRSWTCSVPRAAERHRGIGAPGAAGRRRDRRSSRFLGLGLQDGEEIRWLTYGPAGWQEISLPAPLPAGEVRIADILSPEDLLRGREDMFRPVMERLGADTVDLALAEGVYSVTIRSDAGIETLSFEADTGEVIV